MVEEYSQYRTHTEGLKTPSDAAQAILPNLAHRQEEEPSAQMVIENNTPPYHIEVYPGESGGSDAGIVYRFKFEVGGPGVIYPNLKVPFGLAEVWADSTVGNVRFTLGKNEAW